MKAGRPTRTEKRGRYEKVLPNGVAERLNSMSGDDSDLMSLREEVQMTRMLAAEMVRVAGPFFDPDNKKVQDKVTPEQKEQAMACVMDAMHHVRRMVESMSAVEARVGAAITQEFFRYFVLRVMNIVMRYADPEIYEIIEQEVMQIPLPAEASLISTHSTHKKTISNGTKNMATFD